MQKVLRFVLAVCLCLTLSPACGSPTALATTTPSSITDTAGSTPNPSGEVDAGANPCATGAPLDGAEAARALAEAFFASPYVAETTQGRTLTVSQTESGWQAVLAAPDAQTPTLTLLFATDGRIQQYENSAYPLPTLDGFALEAGGSLEDARKLDALRDALLPCMEYNEGGVYARVGDVAFYALDRFCHWLGLRREGDALRLVAYVDFGTDAARYPGFYTRAEAAAASRQALAEAFGLTAAQTEGFTLQQADFILQQGLWTDATVPLPYWFVVFGDEADNCKSQYEALIDAATGEALELRDPSASGNG